MPVLQRQRSSHNGGFNALSEFFYRVVIFPIKESCRAILSKGKIPSRKLSIWLDGKVVVSNYLQNSKNLATYKQMVQATSLKADYRSHFENHDILSWSFSV